MKKEFKTPEMELLTLSGKILTDSEEHVSIEMEVVADGITPSGGDDQGTES